MHAWPVLSLHNIPLLLDIHPLPLEPESLAYKKAVEFRLTNAPDVNASKLHTSVA